MTPRALLEAAAQQSTHRELAEKLGYSHTAVTLYMNGKYPGGVRRFELAIVDKFSAIDCPFLGRSISRATCTGYATRDCPSASPLALRHWQACQRCALNPTRANAAPVPLQPEKEAA